MLDGEIGHARKREVELKLDVAAADLDRVAAAAGQAGDVVSTGTLISVYFDTPEQALRKAGLSLRVRHDGDRRIQTVKAETVPGVGVFDRPEWEFEIDGEDPDFADDRSALRADVGKKVLRRVVPIFRSVIERTTALATVDDTAIELVVDRGDVIGDAVSVAICEVELELKHGTPDGLFKLARHLDDAGPVRLGVLTKAERGYGLLSQTKAGEASKADPIVLDETMTAVAAFRAIAWSCLRHYRLNENVLLVSGDAGALHQARVALRRLRSALSLFRTIIDDDRFAGFKAELRWLSAVLGDARNVDVLSARARSTELVDRLQVERTKAYAAVSEALASQRSRRLLLDLAEWLTLGVWPVISSKRRDALIPAFAADRLERFRRRLKAGAADFADLPDDERHEVRIEAKKLRYATEFFAGLYTGKKDAARQRRFRNALEDFQSILGDFNDQVTGQQVLAQLGLTEFAADAWNAPDERTDLIARAVESYDALLSAKRFWRP